jgi:hypothetical protein
MRKPPLARFPDFYEGRKQTLNKKEIITLFSNPLIIEEKLDGSLFVKPHRNLYLMLEDMKYVHTIFYNKLPARYILVDVCREDGSRLILEERKKIALETGYPLPPMLDKATKITPPEEAHHFYTLHANSGFGDTVREGFVVKSEVHLFLGGKYSWLDLAGKGRYDKIHMNHITGGPWKNV